MRLADPVYDPNRFGWVAGWDYGTAYESPWTNPGATWKVGWPNWNLADIPVSDFAEVTLGCLPSTSPAHVVCYILPR